MKNETCLYLLPSVISEEGLSGINEKASDCFATLDFFVVEHIKPFRKLFIDLGLKHRIDKVEILENHNKLTLRDRMVLFARFREIIETKGSVGLVSDAGLPAVADPGSNIVALAQEQGIRVVPISGPNSIILALAASGFNGQKFSFHGYLPIDKAHRRKAITKMENVVNIEGSTQIFMETPYRNADTLKVALATLKPHTLFCIAADITGKKEFIRTKPVREWKKNIPDIQNLPAIFLIGTTEST